MVVAVVHLEVVEDLGAVDSALLGALIAVAFEDEAEAMRRTEECRNGQCRGKGAWEGAVAQKLRMECYDRLKPGVQDHLHQYLGIGWKSQFV